MVARATARASSVGQAERAEPVLLAEREGDRVSELDELGLGEVRVQALPELLVGEVAVPRDRVRPGEHGALAVVESGRVVRVGLDFVVLGEVARAQALERRFYEAPIEDGRLRLGVRT